MKNKKLIIAFFTIYWLFVLFLTFSNVGFVQKIKNSALGQTLFPPTYKMYTSPPKQIIQSKYTFYQNGKILQEIDADSLFHTQMKTHFPKAAFKKDLKQYLMLYYAPNVDLGNDVYAYALDSVLQKEKSLQSVLLGKKRNQLYMENQLNFAQTFQPKNADSVELQIKRKFNEVSFDDKKHEKLAYWISDSVLIQKGKKLNDAK